MRKILFTAVVLVLGFTAIWFSRRTARPAKEPHLNAPTSSLAIKAIKAQPIPANELQVKAAVKAEDRIPNSCGSQWEQMAQTSFSHLQEDLKRGVFRIASDCQKYEIRNDFVKKIYPACEYEPQHGDLKNETECFSVLALYRSLWIDRLTPDQKDYHSMSLSLLANKLLARFQEMNQHPENNAEVIKMAEALRDREPNSPDAYKAVVTAKMTGMGSPDYSPQDMSQAIQQALALSPNDPQLTEAYLLNEQMSGNAQAIESFIQQNPNSGLGYYYRAWGSWQAQDREAALADLNQAAQLLPSDARIAKTLVAVQRNEKGSPFLVTVGFNFTDDF